MAVNIINKKGLKVLRTTNVECISWGGAAVCDSCNSGSMVGYMVMALNFWMCPKCFDKWYPDAVRYQEDIPYEDRKFAQYKQFLTINRKETYKKVKT